MNARHALEASDHAHQHQAGIRRRVLVKADFVDPASLADPLDLLRELEPGPFVEQLKRIGASSKQRAREGRPKPAQLDNFVFTGSPGTGAISQGCCQVHQFLLKNCQVCAIWSD